MLGHKLTRKGNPPCLPFLLTLLALTLLGCAADTPERTTESESHPAPSLQLQRQGTTELEPQAPAMPKGRETKYTVARGGTLLNVANLYKIHHHEMVQLNPELDPKRELGPSTEVIVFRDDGQDSESIGLPHRGEIRGGLPMLDGPGRKITAQRWKTWATRSTVRSLDRILSKWAQRYPKAPRVLVGNLSSRRGGPLAPHKTHQSGRDVDLSYIQKWDGKSPVRWQRMNRENLDAKRTWDLLKLIVGEADVRVIYVDKKLQRLLARHAKRNGTIRKNRLGHWLEVEDGPRRGGPLLKHVPGHTDHFHVRFACGPKERDCKEGGDRK